jgi:hypothetical protein
MEISPLSTMMSALTSISAGEQVSLYALKRTLADSDAQAKALLQLMEQVPPQQDSRHQIDVYA